MRYMATRMTGLCKKGANQIWKQCNKELFSQGMTWLEEAAYSGDADAWFFLGECYRLGEGAVEINEKKACDCYRRGASFGSYRAVLGAVLAGQPEAVIKQDAVYSLEESIKELRASAEKGDAYAAYQLGTAYEAGGIPMKCLEEAAAVDESAAADGDADGNTDASRIPQPAAFCISWYKKAADGGIVNAMVKLGICYQSGSYVEQNMERSIDWADKAAALGNVWGLKQMGLYYLACGEMEAAAAYFQAAMQQGDEESPLYLGRMYLHGEGTERNVRNAAEAFELAASRGVAESYIELGNLFYQDEFVERDDEKAFSWYRLAYDAGYKEAAVPLARLYLRTSEIKDCQKAEDLLKEAAETETDGQAALILGNLSRDGLCGRMDLEEAIGWYEKGAEQGNPECMELLGCLFFQGEEGIDTDYARSFYWLSRCMEAGTLQSCSKLAYLYMKGEGCEVDEEKAIELFERAARTEYDGYALYELGYIYEQHSESSEDLEKAAEYYQRAIAMGNEAAVRRFSHFKKGIFGRWKIVT